MDKLLENTIVQIKKAAKYKGQNLKELASSINMSESGLHTAFRRETITYLNVIKICRALGVDIVNLISAAKYNSVGKISEDAFIDNNMKMEIELLNQKLAFREEQLEYYKMIVKNYESQNRKAQ